MATLTDIAKNKLARLELIPDAFINAVEKQNAKLLRDIITAMGKFDVANGEIIANKKNLALITEIGAVLKQTMFQGEYLESVKSLLKQFGKQAQINDALFKESFGKFSVKDLYSQVLSSAQQNTLLLLNQTAIDSAFIVPIQQVLNKSVTTGASFTETINLLTDYIRGNDKVNGKLTRHVKQITRDAFNQFDAQYTNVVHDDLGVEWVQWAGGTIDDTRPFCLERAGNIYHINEVRSWGNGQRTEGLEWPKSGSWAGMIPQTTDSTISVYRGGYNCIHSLLGRDISSVPETVIQRAINNGYIKAAA